MNTVTAFQWKIAGAVLLAILVANGIACGFADNSMRACMRSTLHGELSYVLTLVALAIGVWIGWETAQATHQNWLGWIIGIAVWIGLGVFFMWLGFEPHTSE